MSRSSSITYSVRIGRVESASGILLQHPSASEFNRAEIVLDPLAHFKQMICK
jgi:hypothetical protein